MAQAYSPAAGKREGAFALGFNAFQSNVYQSGAIKDSLGIGRVWTGIALAIITGIVIYGGIKRIAKVADVVVPIMAIGFILMALVNLLTIAMLFPVGRRMLNDYRDQLKQGTVHPVFDPERFPDLDIDKAAWAMDVPEPAASPGDD